MLIEKDKKVVADPIICDITMNNDTHILKALGRLCDHVGLQLIAGNLTADLKIFRD